MEPVDTGHLDLTRLINEPLTYWESIETEADTRLKVINRVFMEVLGWSLGDIHTEQQAGAGFIDYLFTVGGRNRLVVEAKRRSRDLGIVQKKAGMAFKLNGPVFKSPDAQEGIQQAISYCGRKNAELACVTNGRQWIVFRGSRHSDGVDTEDGMAFVFGSLKQVAERFDLFHRLLSYDSASRYLFRADFQKAEGLPARINQFARSLRRPESKRLLQRDQLLTDLDKVMTTFFRNLAGENDPDLLAKCFVRSKESDHADERLARIHEDLRNSIQTLNTGEGEQLTDLIRQVQEDKRNAFVLLVGTKGSGKTTFTDRFFRMVLPADVRQQCVVLRLDLADCGCDEQSITGWLDHNLLDETERVVFDGSPSYEQLQGMYFGEYERWRTGAHKFLYGSDKVTFKNKFGEYMDEQRRQQPLDSTTRMLTRVSKSDRKLPCLVLDNADHFSIEFQNRVFQYVHSVYRRTTLCMVIMPVTDKTSWQLSRQDALQSFFVESLFLPTPRPQQVLKARIEYLSSQASAQTSEPMTGRFGPAGYPIRIDNAQAFAGCLQEVFINTAGVGEWIGNLANYNIRNALKLARGVVSSPHIKVPELVAAYVAKCPLQLDPEDVERAIVRQKYDIHPVGQSEFLHNVFALTTETEASPLLGVRLLRYLDDRWFQNADGEFRYVAVHDLLNDFTELGADEVTVAHWLAKMLETGLCQNYDPTAQRADGGDRIEITTSGRQHLRWATGNRVYLDAMAEVTPVRDPDTFRRLEDAAQQPGRLGRLRGLRAFIEYLCGEDANHLNVPEDDRHASQLGLTAALVEFARNLDGQPCSPDESRTYGVYIGVIKSWDGGYGFLTAPHLTSDVFVHVNDLPGRRPPRAGERFEFQVVESEKGLRATDVHHAGRSG